MISEKDVKYIANLSRIHLNDDEAQGLTKDLEKILDYIKTLESLNIENVTPTSHVLGLKNVYRDDDINPSLSQSDALKIATEKNKGMFKVPPIIE